MVNFAKKIEKHRDQDLHPGETIQAAVIGQPSGSFGRQMGVQLGGVIGAVAAERRNKKRAEAAADEAAATGAPDEGGLAAQVPGGEAIVLGLSVQRLLVFGHSKLSGRPTDLKAAFPIDQVESVSSEKKKLTSSMAVRFSDGSAIDFEIVRPAKPGPFVDAFAALKG